MLAARSLDEVNSVEASWLMSTSVARYGRLVLAVDTVRAAVKQQALGQSVDWTLVEVVAC